MSIDLFEIAVMSAENPSYKRYFPTEEFKLVHIGLDSNISGL